MNNTAYTACDSACQSTVNIFYHCYEFIYILNIAATLYVIYHNRNFVHIEIVVYVIILHSIFASSYIELLHIFHDDICDVATNISLCLYLSFCIL